MHDHALPSALMSTTHHAPLAPDRDPHPFGSWLLQMGFDLWIRALYRREIVLPANFQLAPGSLVASNHQRDIDGPMVGIAVAQRHGLRFTTHPPFYATREDLFRPGILARLSVQWPRPVSALLGHVSLAWLFPLGRTEPMRRTREFTLAEALETLCELGHADDDCWTLLNARGQRETGLTPGACRVADAAARHNPALDAWYGLRRLNRDARRLLASPFRAAVNAQLAHFAGRLDRGACVYFAPEGTISMDGHFGRVRAGSYRLAHMAASPPWVQPMGLAYDALAPGRMRVVICIGTPFRADPRLDRRTFDAALRRAVLQCVPITPSHLLARWLLHGPQRFTLPTFEAWLAHAVATLRSQQRRLDPLLLRKSPRALADTRLRWIERRKLVVRRGEWFRNCCPQDAQAGWDSSAGIACYLDHGLADRVPDAEQALRC